MARSVLQNELDSMHNKMSSMRVEGETLRVAHRSNLDESVGQLRRDLGDLAINASDLSERQHAAVAEAASARTSQLEVWKDTQASIKRLSENLEEEVRLRCLNVADLRARIAAVASSPAQVRLKVHIVSAKGLRSADWFGTSDPYCVCEIVGKPTSRVKTNVKNHTLDPVWNEDHVIAGFVAGDALEFSVYDSELIKADDLLGQLTLTSGQVLPNGLDGVFNLSEAGKGIQATLQVRVVVLDIGSDRSHCAPVGAEASRSITDLRLQAQNSYVL